MGFEEYEDYLGTLDEKKPLDKRKVILFDILLIGISLLLKNFWFTFAAAYFSICISFNFFRFIKEMLHIHHKDECGRSIAKFHSAEHMVVNAYQKLQKVPTLEELKRFSRFHKDCGSCKILREIFYYSFISLAMLFVASWNVLLYIIVIICILILYIMDIKFGCLRFLQISVTSKPTDMELELAIEGLKNFEKMEERLKNQDSNIFSEIELPNNIHPFLFPILLIK